MHNTKIDGTAGQTVCPQVNKLCDITFQPVSFRCKCHKINISSVIAIELKRIKRVEVQTMARTKNLGESKRCWGLLVEF